MGTAAVASLVASRVVGLLCYAVLLGLLLHATECGLRALRRRLEW